MKSTLGHYPNTEHGAKEREGRLHYLYCKIVSCNQCSVVFYVFFVLTIVTSHKEENMQWGQHIQKVIPHLAYRKATQECMIRAQLKVDRL